MKEIYDSECLDGQKYIVQMTNGRQLSKRLHSHTFYEFIIILSGGCIHSVNGVGKAMKENDLAVLVPGDEHMFISQEENTNVLAVSVATDEIENFEHAYGYRFKQHSILSISSAAQYNVLNTYKKMIFCQDNEKLAYCRLIFGKVMHIFVSNESKIPDIPETLSYALSKISSFEYMVHGVKGLEYLSGYSRSQLIRYMKQYVKKTPAEYVTELRMNAAYELVVNSGLHIDDISEKLGYMSRSHFEKNFKKSYNITPAALRKRAKQSL